MNKICVSIFANDYYFCKEVIKKYKFVELRLDEGKLKKSELSGLIKSAKQIICTCRKGFLTNEKRYEILSSAINYGTSFIDIEHSFPQKLKRQLIDKAYKSKVKIIGSYHNLKLTPEKVKLIEVISSLNGDSDIVKIACKVNSNEDLQNLLGLYDELSEGRIISIGLGEMGKISRVAGLVLGAPFMYASVGKGAETVDGQIDYKSMLSIYNKIIK